MGFLIFDLRASQPEGLEDALILDTADTLEEAREAAKDQGGGVIYKDVENVEFEDLVEIVNT